jgi:hypothetical protein
LAERLRAMQTLTGYEAADRLEALEAENEQQRSALATFGVKIGEISRLSTPAPTAVIEGWQLVPKEPTPEMCWAAADIRISDDLRSYNDRYQREEIVGGKLTPHVYRAMLAAAPSLSTPIPRKDKNESKQ